MNKCKIENMLMERIDIILLVAVVMSFSILLFLTMIITVIFPKKCNCSKIIEEIGEKQKIMTESLQNKYAMEDRNSRNENISQNTRIISIMENVYDKLKE